MNRSSQKCESKKITLFTSLGSPISAEIDGCKVSADRQVLHECRLVLSLELTLIFIGK
jgi:hypothetical protein